MSQELDSLVRMADQIAANQPHLTHDDAVQVVATHLRQFWTPAMRRDLVAAVAAGQVELSPVAGAAVDLLRDPVPDSTAVG